MQIGPLFVFPTHLDALYDHKPEIFERHRHRYEVNPEIVNDLEANGMIFVGRDETGKRMEIMELKHDPVDQWEMIDGKMQPKEGHPYYVGCQFHPEYLTRPLVPSPPFLGLILASAGLTHQWFEAKKNHIGEYGSDSTSDLEESPIMLNKDPYTIHPIRGTQMEVKKDY
eukprot:NODE_917_length_3062_cov_0.433345.p2 type:complete len:169 gc:universal NODE_917_length_3062_cov_0.433345:2119-2625(+)